MLRCYAITKIFRGNSNRYINFVHKTFAKNTTYKCSILVLISFGVYLVFPIIYPSNSIFSIIVISVGAEFYNYIVSSLLRLIQQRRIYEIYFIETACHA